MGVASDANHDARLWESLPRWLSGKGFACQCSRHGFDPWIGKNPLEKGMATHSGILAREKEEPSGLQSMGSQRVGCHWATKQQQQENSKAGDV